MKKKSLIGLSIYRLYIVRFQNKKKQDILISSMLNCRNTGFEGFVALCCMNIFQFLESLCGSGHTQTVKLQGESSDRGYCPQLSREFQTNPSLDAGGPAQAKS